MDERIICRECSTTFDRGDSLGSELGICQCCWEEECSASWWEMVASLGAAATGDADGRDDAGGESDG